MTSQIPLPGPARPLPVPRVSERRLSSGLRVLAVRRPGVPLVEVRLHVPFASSHRAHPARAALLTEAFFAGTSRLDAQEIAIRQQRLGASLDAAADADALAVSGSGLAAELAGLLALLAELLVDNAYPGREVAGHRRRLEEELVLARSQPATLAREAVASRLYGDHPYGRELPQPEAVAAVGPAQLRRLHAERVRPQGSVLVLVGDLQPARAIAIAQECLAGWTGAAPDPAVAPPPPAFRPGGLTLVDRPGAVQTNIRLAGPAPDRTEADYPALVLANMVFGGYFSSRLVANIREDKGYTYSPHSNVDHAAVASEIVVDADVATEVTGPSLVEIAYELGRLVTRPVRPEELDAARRYVLGTLALSVSSQAGLAGTLVRLAAAGLDAGWLRSYPRGLARVDPDQVLVAARRWLAPSRLAVVCVGDSERVRDPLAALGSLER